MSWIEGNHWRGYWIDLDCPDCPHGQIFRVENTDKKAAWREAKGRGWIVREDGIVRCPEHKAAYRAAAALARSEKKPRPWSQSF